MTTSAIRQQLHQFIDDIDDNKVIELFTSLETQINNKYTYTAEELNMLHQRAEQFLKGNATLFTVEEAHQQIRQQRKIA